MNDHMMMTAATIPTFSGADPAYTAARWVEDFSDNAEVFGWTPPQKLLIARRVLTGVAGLWLRTEEKFKSFEELQRALLEEFPDKADTKHIHELMTDRKKKMAASAKVETRGEQPADVSVKQESDQRQSNGYGCQSEMSAKQPSIMFEVRTDDTNDYLKEKEVTSMKTKENDYNKCQRQRQTEVVNKHGLQNKKEELLETIEIPIELKSIKVDEDDELYEEKIIEVEKVDYTGEVASVEKKDGSTRRFRNNKVVSEINVIRQLEETDMQYRDDWIKKKIPYTEYERRFMVMRAMEQEIARRAHENGTFSGRIMKDAMTKDYHVLR